MSNLAISRFRPILVTSPRPVTVQQLLNLGISGKFRPKHNADQVNKWLLHLIVVQKRAHLRIVGILIGQEKQFIRVARDHACTIQV